LETAKKVTPGKPKRMATAQRKAGVDTAAAGDLERKMEQPREVLRVGRHRPKRR
jgi:hypothetical protein